MIINLVASACLITATVLVQTSGLILITHLLSRFAQLFHPEGWIGKVITLALAVFGIIAMMGAEIAIWAIFYASAGAFPDFGTSLYFSIVTFSTVGYGGLNPHPDWRLLSAFEGLIGFLFIGWSTVYLAFASTRFGPFREGEHF